MKRALIVACILALAGPGYASIINVTLDIDYIGNDGIVDGSIGLALDDAAAPITVDNFLKYVTDGFYDGLIFHRVIENFMIQGGAFDLGLNQIAPTYAPIVNESDNGLSNLRGTIAMARQTAPDTATSQFFINHLDNASLDWVDGVNDGYAVFGEVTFGMDVVDTIAAIPTFAYSPGLQELPNTPVVIISAYVTSVPEPATIIMLGLGGLSLLKRKKK